MASKSKLKRKLNVSRVIVLGFVGVILLGTLLLMLPVSTADGKGEAFLNCLFTATSATCVTGLVVVDTAVNWSYFGQAVILCLIQIGGLGFMTLAVALSMLVKRTISPQERLIMAQSVNVSNQSGLIKLTKKILTGTLIAEGIGALLLMTRFVPIFGGEGVWKAVFVSVSAFCNAGFDLMGTYSGEFSSLTAFYGDPVVCLTITFLILFGGIGFVVWNDFYELLRNKKRLPAYTKIIALFSIILVVGGTLVFMVSEWNNTATIGKFSVSQKIINSLFQAVSPRTAGFNTVDLSHTTGISKMLIIILMFIGGCSGSTAGGIKVGTFAVIIFAVISALKGKREIIAFRRKISDSDVLRAFSITVLQLGVTLIGAALIISDGNSVMDAMFEAFSASATVGLSLSLTPTLGLIQKIAIIVMMFFGRVGIITVSFATMLKMSQYEPEVCHAETKMMIG